VDRGAAFFRGDALFCLNAGLVEGCGHLRVKEDVIFACSLVLVAPEDAVNEAEIPKLAECSADLLAFVVLHSRRRLWLIGELLLERMEPGETPGEVGLSVCKGLLNFPDGVLSVGPKDQPTKEELCTGAELLPSGVYSPGRAETHCDL